MEGSGLRETVEHAKREALSDKKMSFSEEFAVVDLVVASGLPTRGVDAFALSLIKAERQIRRLFTYLVFQCDAFKPADVRALRAQLANRRRCYFDGFERGINNLYGATTEALIGAEYALLRVRINEAIAVRNKIFHGRLTDKSLSTDDLLGYVRDARRWCELLADSATREVGYDGFLRNSFRKANSLAQRNYKRQVAGVEDYGKFLDEFVQRPN